MAFARKQRGIPRKREELPENPERREFLRFFSTAARGIAASSLLNSLGCGPGLYTREPEHVIYLENNHARLSAAELGFREGETDPDEAADIMRQRGLTHVVLDTNTSINARINRYSVSALTADYQHNLHIFRNRKYEQTVDLEIPTAERPHRYALRVTDYQGKKMVLALIRDAITDVRGFGVEPPRMALIPYEEGAVGEIMYSQLRSLERRNGGLQYPLFVGYDLDAGITFIARDKRGRPWEDGYIVTWDGERLRGRPVGFLELMQCDCVGQWARQSD